MLRSTTLVLALTLALGARAFAADDAKWTQPSQPEQVAALVEANAMNVKHTENYAEQAYAANINPLSFMLEKVGPYDLQDAFTGSNGFPLPGWEGIANPASMGSGGGDSD